VCTKIKSSPKKCAFFLHVELENEIEKERRAKKIRFL